MLGIIQAVLPSVLGLVGDLIAKHGGNVEAIEREITQIRDHSKTWTNARDAMQAELAAQKKKADP